MVLRPCGGTDRLRWDSTIGGRLRFLEECVMLVLAIVRLGLSNAQKLIDNLPTVHEWHVSKLPVQCQQLPDFLRRATKTLRKMAANVRVAKRRKLCVRSDEKEVFSTGAKVAPYHGPTISPFKSGLWDKNVVCLIDEYSVCERQNVVVVCFCGLLCVQLWTTPFIH